ncbi:MAG: hypothetical protein SOU03_07975 [Dorea sp.]|nr:hypothetical protein [Dorea sp.]
MRIDLNLFGLLEDECVETVEEVMKDYPGMETKEALMIALISELRKVNDRLDSLGVQLEDIGRIAECVDDSDGCFCIKGTIGNYQA